MMTYTEHKAIGNNTAYVTARIVLASGVVAGEGYGPTREWAAGFAIEDARDAGYVDAANGHARTVATTEVK